MKLPIYLVLVLTGLFLSTSSQAASIYAGQVKAAEVCSQCHGVRANSVDSVFPDLAGRDADYLKIALKQYRDKTRISVIMNNIAGSLSDRDISNVAAYYGRLKP